MKKKGLACPGFLFFLFFPLFALCPLLAGPAAANRDVVLTLPADTVLTALRGALPLTIPTRGKRLEGDIIVESVDQLSVDNNVLTVKALLASRDMSLNIKVAGAPVRMQVAEMRMPVHCDLALRLDATAGVLYVAPRFPGNGRGEDANGPAGLLGNLGGKEFPISLGSLRRLDLGLADKSLRLDLTPVSLTSRDNCLIIALRPRVVQAKNRPAP